MGEFLASLFTLGFVLQTLRITVPYALAALGGVMSERSGVVNIALEGILLTGAFVGAVISYQLGAILPPGYGALTVLAAISAGVVGGCLIAAIYALVVVHYKADQIVAGVAINLLASGITPYLLELLYDSASTSPKIAGFETVTVSDSLGILGNPVFWLVVALAFACYVVMWKTRWGLRLRAVGDHPEAAHTLGISVNRVRWQAVLASGALAGLGGAWLALSNRGFVAEMSNGRGYIALAAVIMGSWRPRWAVAACLLFGFAEALQIKLSTYDIGVPNQLTQMFPYLLTMITLAGFIGRSRPPRSIGQPYDSD